MDLIQLTPEQLKELKAYRKVVLFGIFFLLLGVIFYHQVEQLSWLDSFYFTVITLATVGYGDIVPHTNLGKIFTIFYVFIGIALFVTVARIVVQYSAVRHFRKRQEKNRQKK